MTDGAESRNLLLGRYGKLLVFSLIAGLIIRFAVMPLTYEYDIYHWAMIVQNINSGNGLYELNGYFYTPVWGYVLGSIDAFWNTFLSIDVFGMRIPELLDVENMANMNHVATITSPEFNFALKTPLVLIDLAVGAAVYSIVRTMTGNRRKAEIGFTLWFLCPVAIYMSAIQGMFDNLAGLLTLLSVILVLRRHYYLGGMLLMTGILLKLYPGFALTVIIALIYARRENVSGMVRDIATLFAGGISGFLIIMLPTMLDGTFWYAFTFITDRSGGFSGFDGMFWLLGIAISAVVMIYFTVAMARTAREEADRVFLRYVMLALVGGIIANLGPQYPLTVLPLMCVYIAAVDRSYFICWLLIGVGCALQALVLNNYSLLMTMASYWGWPSFDTILWGLDWTETYIIGTGSFRSMMNTVFSMVAFTGLVLAVLFEFQERLDVRCQPVGRALGRIRSFRQPGGE